MAKRQKKMISLICGDSMKLMPLLRERVNPSFDCIFLDPPFFDWSKEWDVSKISKRAATKPNHNALSHMTTRLLTSNGVVWLCGTQPQLIDDWRFWNRWFRLVFEVIQYKHAGVPPINMYQPIRTHENIWCLFRKKDKVSKSHLNIKRLTKTGHTTRKKRPGAGMRIRYGEEWKEWKEGVGYPKTVFECQQIKGGSKEYLGHPTQKPENLMNMIIKMSTKQGDTILDPFAGSGTTLTEAQELNRNCLGIEISPEYCKLIKRRLKERRKCPKITSFIP